jgi:hypothetical protein
MFEYNHEEAAPPTLYLHSLLLSSYCLDSAAFSSATRAQYLVALLARSPLPYLIMKKKTEEAAMPTNAAEMKQF